MTAAVSESRINSPWRLLTLLVVAVSTCPSPCAETGEPGTPADQETAPPRPASPADEARNKAPSERPYRVATEQILFRHAKSFHPSQQTRTVDKARELARRVLEAIRAEKLTFHQACERHSEDPVSRKNGGYMGIFERGELASDFEAVEEAIFSLKTGEVSDPVDSPLGVHLFRRVRIEEWAGRRRSDGRARKPNGRRAESWRPLSSRPPISRLSLAATRRHPTARSAAPWESSGATRSSRKFGGASPRGSLLGVVRR